MFMIQETSRQLTLPNVAILRLMRYDKLIRLLRLKCGLHRRSASDVQSNIKAQMLEAIMVLEKSTASSDEQ